MSSSSTRPGAKADRVDRCERRREGTINRGIYRLKGDELAICVNTEVDKEAPGSFMTTEDTAWVLYSMKRAAKGKEDTGKEDELDLPAEPGHRPTRCATWAWPSSGT